METVRWGIIGCGDVTEVKSGPALQNVGGSQLVAVMRRSGDSARDYSVRHGVPKWYDGAERLIRDPDVDAIYIATPPGSHCEYAMRVCEAGKPAYVEKPMARNHAECRQMIGAFQQRGLPLFVAYYRRALPRFLKAKQKIDAGCLGTITAANYRYQQPAIRIDPQDLPWRLRADESGGGLFFDLGSHALDILDYLLGPLVEVVGAACNRASRYDVEDNVVMHFRTQEGIPGTAMWNFAGSFNEDRIEIVGTEGRLSLSVFGNEPVNSDSPRSSEQFDFPNPKHIQQPLLQTVVDELLGRGKCGSTGESAARTAAVMDQVTESYYGSREGPFWTLPESWPGRPGTQAS